MSRTAVALLTLFVGIAVGFVFAASRRPSTTNEYHTHYDAPAVPSWPAPTYPAPSPWQPTIICSAGQEGRA